MTGVTPEVERAGKARPRRPSDTIVKKSTLSCVTSAKLTTPSRPPMLITSCERKPTHWPEPYWIPNAEPFGMYVEDAEEL